ncbi:hypothetical protein ABPG77_008537 [Micractinium sp. CCAP 211/92]
MAASAGQPQDATHQAWKRMVPYLYDSMASHALPWPALAVRWGPVVEQGPKRTRQRAYLSEQTDGSVPNLLMAVDVELARPRTATADQLLAFTEHSRSPHVSRPVKTVVHPGEVNRIRELPQHPHVLVTHTDAPQLYVWNMEAQPDRAGVKNTSPKQHSVADLVLEGHKEAAEFALGVSSAAPLAASGGRDAQVLVWDLASHATSLALPSDSGDGDCAVVGTRLQPAHTLKGHASTIEDVCWQPGSVSELASVGDDFSLLLWDTRHGSAPVLHVARAHGPQDVHCVSWNPHRQDLLVTGAADGSLKVWDRRKTSSPTFSFRHHAGAATVVEWSPHAAGAFASAGEDRLLCVWDLDAPLPDADGVPAPKRQKSAIPHQLLFQHAGHRAAVVDLHWNPHDPWTLLSVADEAGEGGGGTLHAWRISDLVYRPADEVVAELEPYRDYILTGNEASLSRKPSTSGQLAGGPGAGTAHLPSGQDRSPAADAGSRGDAPSNGAHCGATL